MNNLKTLIKLSIWLTVLALGFTTFAESSQAADSWSKEEIALEIAWEILHTVDTLNTLDIKNHQGYYEINPIMGKHPNDKTVLLYMGAGYLLHPIITNLLPDRIVAFDFEIKPKHVWQSITLMVTGSLLTMNRDHGLGIAVNINF